MKQNFAGNALRVVRQQKADGGGTPYLFSDRWRDYLAKKGEQIAALPSDVSELASSAWHHPLTQAMRVAPGETSAAIGQYALDLARQGVNYASEKPFSAARKTVDFATDWSMDPRVMVAKGIFSSTPANAGEDETARQIQYGIRPELEAEAPQYAGGGRAGYADGSRVLGALSKAAGEIAKKQAQKKLVPQPQEAAELPGFTVYHGSPHQFEKFDISKIGTGEGNASYGRGLYFAEKEPIAKSYRDTLSAAKAFDDLPGYSQSAAQLIRNRGEAGEQMFRQHYSDLGPEKVEQAIEEAKNAITNAPVGHMYEARINAPQEHFLDWNKPFHEQSEYVQNSLMNIPNFENFGHYKSGMEMGELINRGLLPHTYDKSSQEFLQAYKDAGIPGIKYLDQGSRVEGIADPTRNYVVFDDNLIDTMRRYANGGFTYPLDDRSNWNENADYQKTGGTLKHMSPDAFLDKAKPLDMGADDKKSIDKFKKEIKTGHKVDPAAIYPEGGQDGRHHVAAAKKLGIKSVPVITWPKKTDGGSIVDRALVLTSKKAKSQRGRP
jgi:hypothetical protein